MEWFVIFLALGVAIGPMLYLMPTDRDRHVTALRAQAKKMGYTVQLDKVLKLDPDYQERVTAGGGVRHPAVSCARYQLPLGVTLNQLAPLTLMRIPARPTLPIERLSDNWGVLLHEPAQQKGLVQWRYLPTAIAETTVVLQQLPDDVLGVHFDKRFVAAFWMEKSPTTQDHKSPPLALFWPKRKSKAAQTAADFPRLQRLDATMRALVNASKKHWGVGSE
jgi:hypothetical protein